MTCVIIDDEPLAVKILKEYAAAVPDLEVKWAGTDVFKALEVAQDGGIDLVFLDVQMPELNGIQFLKILNGKSKVILTTAYEEYALQAFDMDVADYLLKPFSKERFLIALQKVKERLAPAAAAASSDPEFIFVKSEYRILKINVKDIFYFESLRDYVAIHHKEGKTLTLQSLKSFEADLPTRLFVRIHKSYIIALQHIEVIEKKKVIIQGKELPISDTYYTLFRNRLPE